jgi:hypothetical protein
VAAFMGRVADARRAQFDAAVSCGNLNYCAIRVCNRSLYLCVLQMYPEYAAMAPDVAAFMARLPAARRAQFDAAVSCTSMYYPAPECVHKPSDTTSCAHM